MTLCYSMPLFFTARLLVQEFHEIVPPVGYSLIPTWLVFLLSFFSLAVLGLAAWWIARKLKRQPPVKSIRDKALEALEEIREQIEILDPYQFSIQVSDILRRYVTQQYNLPVTRQTSVEFLEHLTRSSEFSGDDKSLLGDFLSRCDLIKFARYQATTEDSRLLLDEATRFVKGGELAAVT